MGNLTHRLLREFSLIKLLTILVSNRIEADLVIKNEVGPVDIQPSAFLST